MSVSANAAPEVVPLKVSVMPFSFNLSFEEEKPNAASFLS
jgi:hypothetical protein